jgi:hypothetical protein
VSSAVSTGGGRGAASAGRSPTASACIGDRVRPAAVVQEVAVTVDAVRLTQFRELMVDEFGAARAAALSRDHVFAELGGRTVDQALEAGIDPRRVWRAVCDVYEVPPARR